MKATSSVKDTAGPGRNSGSILSRVVQSSGLFCNIFVATLIVNATPRCPGIGGRCSSSSRFNAHHNTASLEERAGAASEVGNSADAGWKWTEITATAISRSSVAARKLIDHNPRSPQSPSRQRPKLSYIW